MFTKDDVGQPAGRNARQLTDTEREAIADEWNANLVPTLADIAAERERRLDTSIAVTLSDGDYTIPVNDRSAALGTEAFRRAKDDGSTRPFPTDKGIVERDANDLNKISKALDDYITGVWRRAAELQRKVEDGTISEDDLTSGWP